MANMIMPSFVDLPPDVFPYIFRYLDMEDMIAFALSCQLFGRMCVDAKVFRKMDLSGCTISTTQRGEIKKFFRDRQLIQNIRELDISNLRVLNWQIDNLLEEFIISICPHLEALHILNCGMGLQRLHHILKQAPKLTALSWSLRDLTSEDIQFLLESMKSYEGICLRNIKHLHLEILSSTSHIRMAKYLLLSCFRHLEELEVHSWWISKAYRTGWNFPLPVDRMIAGFPQPSVENELPYLHSLVVVTVGGQLFENYCDSYREELYDFVVSVLRRRSSSTKWKKLWISPSIYISTRHLTDLSLVHEDDFQSVEAIAAYGGPSISAVDYLKTLFQSIGDNTVRSLHLCLPDYSDSIAELYGPILRVGGDSLKFLRLSVHFSHGIHGEQNVFTHTLFPKCLNITELDLFGCHYENVICEALSELKQLSKVQLMECAINSKHNNENQAEISKANLQTFVENCNNITHLDIRGCGHLRHFSCRLTDNDLLALAVLTNLKSLTLYDIHGIRDWAFLRNISEHCKFLTMLRIHSTEQCFGRSYIPILESAKFLKHLVISVPLLYLGSEVFWNLLSHAKSLERLCIRNFDARTLNVPVALETLKSLPRLHVLHLHSRSVEGFYDQIIRMLGRKESDCRFSFEIVIGSKRNMSRYRRNIWIHHQTGYSLISSKALPLNKAELCNMGPVLAI